MRLPEEKSKKLDADLPEEKAVRRPAEADNDLILTQPGSTVQERTADLKAEIEKRIQAEYKYRRIFEDAIEGIFQSTLEGRFIYANPSLARMFGYSSPQELIDSITDIGEQVYVNPETRALIVQNLIENGKVEGCEIESYRRDKSKFCVLLNANIVRDANGQILYIQGMNIDITERKRVERALQESENNYRQLVQNTTAVILRIDLEGRVKFINNYAQALFGYSEDEILGRHIVGTIVPERESTGRDLAAMMDQIIADPDRFIRFSNENIRKNGERVWVEWTNSGIFDHENELTEVLSVGIDFTARKMAEDALKESESKYKTFFESTGTATFIVEEDMTISLVNSEFEKITGWSKPEIEGKETWKLLFAPDDHHRLSKFHEMRRQGKHAPLNYETRIVDKNGQLKILIINADIIPGTRKSIVSGIDITSLKKTEKELKKREQELKERSRKLEEANAALRALLRSSAEQKREIEDAISTNIKELVVPYVEKLRRNKLQDRDEIFGIIINNLTDISSPLTRNLRALYSKLTPKEIQVVNLIRDGRTSKEISDIMNISTRGVEFHRESIREKLGIKNKKTNLLSFLLSTEDNK